MAKTRDLISMTAQCQREHKAINKKTQEQKNFSNKVAGKGIAHDAGKRQCMALQVKSITEVMQVKAIS